MSLDFELTSGTSSLASPRFAPVRRSALVRPELLAPAADRVPLMDACRFLAATATVFSHLSLPVASRVFLPITRFALPFFVIAGVFFLFRRGEAPSAVDLLGKMRKRAFRLAAPFAFWSVLYALMRVAKHRWVLRDGWPRFEICEIWTGTAYHLWFLPFMVLASIVTLLLIYAAGSSQRRQLVLAGVCAVIGTALVLIPLPDSMATRPILYLPYGILRMTPSVCFGASLGLLKMSGVWNGRSSRNTALAALAVVVALTLALAATPSTNIVYRVERHLCGMAWFVLALWPVRNGAIDRLASMGRYSYGIFLAHPALLQASQWTAASLGLMAMWGGGVGIYALALAGSIVVAVFLYERRPTRSLIGG